MLRPRRRPAALALTGAALLLTATFAGLVAVRSLSGLSVAPQECARTVPLTPHTDAGLPWEQHRHTLVPDSAVPDTLSFLIWNRRSGDMFEWDVRRASGRVDRFLVPTRYAELLNRDWDDDPWLYCLVLDSEPPFRFKRNGFTTSTVVGPARVRPGDSVRATVTVMPRRTMDASLAVLVLAPDKTVVAQHTFAEQSLRAGATVEYQTSIALPTGAAEGVYVVKVGLFSRGWTSVLHWNDGTAAFLVDDKTR